MVFFFATGGVKTPGWGVPVTVDDSPGIPVVCGGASL